MTVFAEKLGGLATTIELALSGPVAPLAAALEAGVGRTIVAVGSGGSAVAAEYLARCRTTLGLGATIVRTPMELVVGDAVPADETWLLSAGADNPDIAAALRTAIDVGPGPIRMVTTRAKGVVAIEVEQHPRGSTFVLPVADPKDGFLATHSLVATTAALLAAAALCVDQPASEIGRFAADCRAALEEDGLTAPAFRSGDTILLLHDPQVRAVATLIETSLWETGIAPVQKVDFRNFAHGRHVWAARHPDTMLMLALTSAETRDTWESIAAVLPPEIRRASYDFGNAGRGRVATGIVEGLAIVRALGEVAGIDPGRPGSGEFAKAIYEDRSLLRLAEALTPPVRHKRRAVLAHDATADHDTSICAVGSERVRELGSARFGGLVFDYDGTLVATANRFDPPSPEIIAELTRLLNQGVRVGIATGRGGSAGEILRSSLPVHVHPLVLVGYYNGGFLRTLDVDIRDDAPEPDPGIATVAEWLSASGLLLPGIKWRQAPVQITIEHAHLRDARRFAKALQDCPAVAAGRVRVLSSHHSFDLVPAVTSKLAVVRALRRAADDLVLCVGDSGSPLGNDYELLSEPHGTSVDAVCGSASGCWSLFGEKRKGPDAVLRLLRSLGPVDGGVAVDVDALKLDS